MAQPIAYYEDGTPIPAEEWEQAVQSGQARWEGGTEIRAVSPDGSRVTLPAEQYADAIASGYRIASPEEVARAQAEQEHGGLGGMALAGVEGAARGLTFGLSDQIAVGFGGEDYRQAAAARREVNPGAAAAGEIVGAVAPIIATGGTGAAARVTAGAGLLPRGAAAAGRGAGALAERMLARQAAQGGVRSIVARGVAGAAEAGVEGALYGVGQAISDNALTDADLTADKILSSAGEGALFAGLLGGALGGTLGAASLGFGAARDVALRRLGSESTSEALQRFADRRAFKQVTGNYKKPVLAATAKGDGALERMGRKLIDERAPMRKLDEFVPWVEKRTQRAADDMRAVASQLDDAGVKLDGQALLRRADEVINSYASRMDDDFRKVANRLRRKIKPLRNAIDPPQPKAKGKQKIVVDPVFGTRVIDPVAPPAPAPREFSFSEFWKIRQDLDKTINWGKRSGDMSTDAMKELRDAFRAELDDMIERGQGPLDLKTAWKKASEDYGDFVLLKDHAEEYAKNRASNRSVSLTDYLAGIGGAATSIATGNVGGLLGAGAMTVGNKLAREQGNYLLARMADRLAKFDGRFEAATQALAGLRKLELRKAIAPAATSIPERYRETTEQVKQLQDPRRAVEVLARVGEGLEDRPDILHALHQRVLGDAHYLHAQMPRALTRSATSLTPNAEEVRVPPSEMRRFMAKVDALADPLKVLEDVAEGDLDRDAIDALRERRPRLFQAIREQVMIYAAQRGEELPFKQRITLSLAFDFRGDHSLQPEVLTGIQQVHAERGADAEAPGPSGNINPQLAANETTPAQQAIGGRA